ncbi:MAG: oxidoreductase, partial [Aestuariibacter sp.]|nr:oxidoreductase [Aestuariibacter sp.]
GLFLSNGGYEYALALFAATLSLVFSGAGRLAVDNLIANKFASAQ